MSAIAFKAVHGGRISGVQRVTPELLAAMEEMIVVAPVHNPAYITAMRLMREKLPEIPLVAAFETDFHQTISDRNTYYAVPYDWAEKANVRRYGFHGASHRYIAVRTAELARPGQADHLLPPRRVEFALRDPRRQERYDQHGIQPPKRTAAEQPRRRFRSLRTLPVIMKHTGKSLEEVLAMLTNQSGLLGLSGTCNDMRDIDEAVSQGRSAGQARLRRFRGRHSPLSGRRIWWNSAGPMRSSSPAASARTRRTSARRSASNLEELGIVLDQAANAVGQGRGQDPRPVEPRADLGRSDQRRVDRRAAWPPRVLRMT